MLKKHKKFMNRQVRKTEESHGGDEASKEIKDSPNAAKDGENSQREKSRRREKE